MTRSTPEELCARDHRGCTSPSCLCACHLSLGGEHAAGGRDDLKAHQADLPDLDDDALEDRGRASRQVPGQDQPSSEQVRAAHEELLRAEERRARRLDETTRRRDRDRRWGRERRGDGRGRSL